MASHLFGVLVVVLGLIYAAHLLAYAVGWRRVGPERSTRPPDHPPSVSIVLAVRNEAGGIEACLDAILQNDYPPECTEVIVVDDCSDDDTLVRLRALERARASDQNRIPHLHVLEAVDNVTRSRAHKKAALVLGMNRATGEIVLVTDGDTRMGPSWVSTMVGCFGNGVDFVAGPVVLTHGRSWFARMQAIEFLGWIALGAGAIGIGRPLLCNGANLAFRRDAYRALGRSPHDDEVTSGDDVLLMQRIAERTPGSVAFCASAEALVTTSPQPSLSAFFEQRKRWASKGTSFVGIGRTATVLGLALFQTALVFATIASFTGFLSWDYTVAAWLLKILPEWILVAPACRRFAERGLLRYLLPASLLQPVYVVLAGALGLLRGYTWKGRPIRR